MVIQSWDRLNNEGEGAYAAFEAYLMLGPTRTAIEAYRHKTGIKPASQPSGEWNKWAKRFRWEERARDYDNHQNAVRRFAVDRAAAKEAAKWERRRQAELEKVWSNSEIAEAKLLDMLASPLETTRTTQDGKRVLLKPARWAFRDAIAGLKVVAELRAAVLAAATADLGEMTDAEIDGTASGPGED